MQQKLGKIENKQKNQNVIVLLPLKED